MRTLAEVKNTLAAHRGSSRAILRNGIRALDAMRTVVRFVTNPTYRSILWSRMLAGDAVHQTTVLTWSDRYPRIFAACRDCLGATQEINILSFGCSTGEEVITLRRYFPTARIVGADINARNIALCKARLVDERITFIDSRREVIKGYGLFDVIFCMAVLQRTPHRIKRDGITSLKNIYPFEKFDRQVGELDSYLRPGGLLVVHHSQYLLSESSVAERYTTLETELDPDDTLKFGRDSLRRVGTVATGSIFLKRNDGGA